MLLSVFEKYIFLQSLGWGIISSLWQAGLLVLLYKTITSYSNGLSPAVKYNAAVLLQSASFVWFISTVVQNYAAAVSNRTAAFNWLQVSLQLNQLLQWLSVIYCLVLTIHVLLFIKRVNRLLLLRNRSVIKAPAAIRIFTDQSAFHLGISKKVNVWLSENAAVPSVIGFFKPVILLPAMALNNLTQSQAEAVILHELAHIRRNDYLVNFFQSMVEMLMFYNPFVKLLGAEIRKERENCCDDWVMNYRYNRHDYAAALLALEQYRFENVQLAPAATNGKKNLLARIKRLFAEEPEVNMRLSQKIKIGIAAFSLLAIVLLALPVTSSRESTGTTVPETNYAIFTGAVKPVYSENKKLAIIIADKPAERKLRIRKPPVNRTTNPSTEENIELSTALINAELLEKEQQPQSFAIAAGNTEAPVQHKLYVQVEEEQSGSADKKTYVVELNNDNGIANIKPLLLLDKKVKNISRHSKKSNAKRVMLNKRVTS